MQNASMWVPFFILQIYLSESEVQHFENLMQFEWRLQAYKYNT